ncbi:hypothetical protein RDI58_015026 [Solanum bulbocastanum]|uniref:Uncharacterized protein n=1 Tax=Solanum bulbocastanum TaxID=147425 RepID=A0AAN8TMI0_SOLBU
MRSPARGKKPEGNKEGEKKGNTCLKYQEGVSTGLGDTGTLSALVDEVIDTAAGDIIENLAGKIIQEDASQSLENIQDDENKT